MECIIEKKKGEDRKKNRSSNRNKIQKAKEECQNTIIIMLAFSNIEGQN